MTERLRALPPWVMGLAGVVILVAVWWLAAGVHLLGQIGSGDNAAGIIPTPLEVITSYGTVGFEKFESNFGATLGRAAKGFLWGNIAAIGLALIVMVIPPIEVLATQIAVLSYCAPLVAVAPLVAAIFQPESATVFLAAISVFFTTLIGTLAGLKSADRASLDLISAYGGGRVQKVLKVQLIAAIPQTLAALKIAAPAALLGAILGEYLGGVDSGVGVFLTQAQASANPPQVWGIALVAAAIAGAGYGIVAVISALAAPWAAGGTR